MQSRIIKALMITALLHSTKLFTETEHIYIYIYPLYKAEVKHNLLFAFFANLQNSKATYPAGKGVYFIQYSLLLNRLKNTIQWN